MKETISFVFGCLCTLLALILVYGERNEKIAVKSIEAILEINEKEQIDSICYLTLPKNVRVVFNGKTYHAQCYIPAYTGATYKEWTYIWEYDGETSRRWNDHFMPLNPVEDSCAAKKMAFQYLGYKQREKNKVGKGGYQPIK